MKINSITANNFLRLNLLDLDLSGAVGHLIAGENEAGKTSIYEAVRLALTGEVVRVSLKRNYKTLIRAGAKTGTISVVVDGQTVTRDVKTAEQTNEPPYQCPGFLPFLLDAQKFSHTKEDIRRKMLFQLTETKIDRANIVKRLEIKGCDAKLCEEITPMLRSGFDAAHDAAQKRATTARAQWTGLTGQSRYGSQIASDWRPKPPKDYDPQVLLDTEAKISGLQTMLDQLNQAHGAKTAELAAMQAQIERQEKAGEYDPEQLKKLEAGKKTEVSALETLETTRERINREIAIASERAPVTCCECGTQLKVSFLTKPGQGTVAEVSKFVALSDEQKSQLQQGLAEVTTKMRKIRESIETLSADIFRQKSLRDSKNDGHCATAADLEQAKNGLSLINQDIAGVTAERDQLQADVAPMREAAGQVKNADETEKRAQELHRSVEAWTKIYEQLAPEGIPAELLADALGPVNSRLLQTATITGWPIVNISPTMEISAGGDTYTLLSASAKWRADAAIAEAIAHLSGLSLLMLDGADILSIRNRGALLKWMAKILPEYDTVLIFATLKELPSKLPTGMAAHWVENGEIKDQESAA